MRATTTLILGAGPGGIAAANTLRRALPAQHRIVVVEKSPTVLIGAGKTWVMLGLRTPEQISRRVESLLALGVELLAADVTRIDPDRGEVFTEQEHLHGDHLVIALGANLNMGAVPGLQRAASTFYALQGALDLRERLREFNGGEIVLLIPRTPFKCPPGPYEAAMLLRHHFNQRGLGDKVRISLHTVEGAPMATAGPQMGQFIRSALAERGITLHNVKKTKAVNAAQRVVEFEDGSTVRYDLLIAIPPHEPPRAVRHSGLTAESGWIPVDPATLQMRGPSRPCFAIGDVCGVPLPGRFRPELPLALPKAAVFAQAQGEIVAAQIAANVLGKPAQAKFDGKGYCYIELGAGLAVKGEGEFFAVPHPSMAGQTPSAEQYQAKVEWVEEWVRRAP
jgi:sulfide:quinone oxidoreductase